MRRLSFKKRVRSASIAVPGVSCSKSNSAVSLAEDEVPEPLPKSPLLHRSCSERRYRSMGNVRNWTASDLQDLSADSWQKYYLRCFSVSSKGGIVSRADYVRYRRVRSLSLAPGLADSPTLEETDSSLDIHKEVNSNLSVPTDSRVSSSSATSSISDLGIEEFNVYLVGSSGVGKSALTQQFTTSEHILNNTSKEGDNEEPTVTVMLEGEESCLRFKEITNISSIKPFDEASKPSAFLVVYSVTQVETFLAATYILCQLHQLKFNEDSVIILVGNKSDLVRSRLVNFEEGQSLAANYRVKFIETSVGINYNVDELLVGVLTHLRVLMQRRNQSLGKSSKWPRFSRARSSLRRMIDRVLKKEDSHDISCDIFKVS